MKQNHPLPGWPGRSIPATRGAPVKHFGSAWPARDGPETRIRDGTDESRQLATISWQKGKGMAFQIPEGLHVDRKGKYFYKHSIPLELCNEIINRVPVNDTGIHDGTWINPRDGTTIIRARDGTFLREKIPKPPDLNRPGEGKIYAVNNRKTGLNGNDMKKDRRRLPAGQAGKHEVGSPIEFKPSFGKERIEKMDTSSVVLCENSVNSVVKNELLK